MSRCFPFPPPGYERKHITEDLDLLKEAKRKEKKHKKEKKDKERKKDKEKEKDGNDEKHKDKKDRKGKHKDKKEKHRDNKDKEDRVKDKEKSSISEESTVAGKIEDKSGKKLHPKVPTNDRSSTTLNDGKSSALFQGQNGQKLSQSTLPPLVNDESRFIRELDRRIRDEEKGTGSQLPEKVAVLEKKHQEKAENKNKKIERKPDLQGFGNEYGGNTVVQKSKVGVIPNEQNGRVLEDKEKHRKTSEVKRGDKQKDRDKEKEKNKEKEKKLVMKTEKKSNSKDDGRNDFGGITGNKTTNLLKDINCTAANEGHIRKRNDMGTNGFLHENEIRPNKMQRPGPHQLIENGTKLRPSQTPTKSPHNKPNGVGENSIDTLMMNGIIVGPTPKPSPSRPKPIAEASKIDSHHMMNGIIGGHKPSPSRPKPIVDGIIGAQKPSPSRPKPIADVIIGSHNPSPSRPKPVAEASKNNSHHVRKPLKVPNVEDLISEASRRPPHPDSKYMAEVLTVPKIDEWPEIDDQEWLFRSKPNVGPVAVKEYPRVWSEAVHIESADVYALPYVIPY